MKEAATSLEEESEEIAEEFLSGRMEVDKFLSSYSAKRMVIMSFIFCSSLLIKFLKNEFRQVTQERPRRKYCINSCKNSNGIDTS